MNEESRGDQITIKELREELKLKPSEFCELIGIKKSAYYNKINGLTDWTMSELVKLLEIKQKHRIKGKLTVSLNGIEYNVSITKIA